MVRKTSEMVEAGILSAIAVLFAVVATYVPVLGAFVNFLWPVPIAVCGVRNGLRWSIMTLVVAGAVLGAILGPIQAFTFMSIFGLMGLALGEALRRGYSATKILGIASVATLISIVFSLFVTTYIMGTDPISFMFDGFEKYLAESSEYYEAFGMSKEATAQAMESNKQMLAAIKLALPASFVLCGPLLSVVNYYVLGKVLARVGMTVPALPLFKKWYVPAWVIWPYALSIMGLSFFGENEYPLLYHIAVNLQMLAGVAFFIQGLALVWWATERFEKPKAWAIIFVAAAFGIPLVSMIAVLAGAVDTVFDYRELREI